MSNSIVQPTEGASHGGGPGGQDPPTFGQGGQIIVLIPPTFEIRQILYRNFNIYWKNNIEILEKSDAGMYFRYLSLAEYDLIKFLTN